MLLWLGLTFGFFYFSLLLVTNFIHLLQFFLQFVVFKLKLFDFFLLLWPHFLENLLKFICTLRLSIFLRYFLRIHLWQWFSTSFLNLRFYSIHNIFFIFFKLILDFGFLFNCLFQLFLKIFNLRSRYLCLFLTLLLAQRLLAQQLGDLIIGKIFNQTVLTLCYLVFNESCLST